VIWGPTRTAWYPYSTSPGNHDYDSINSHNSATQYDSYFGASRYEGRSWYGGASAEGVNQYQLFSAGGYQFLHISLEWEPRGTSLSWVQQVVDSHPGIPTLVTTHAYVPVDGGHFVGTTTFDGNDGESIFDNFVRVNPQIFMVMNGHFTGERHQISINDAGYEVYEVLANYQNRPNGGDGWMRLFRFQPDLDRIEAVTYSPTLDQFETDPDSQFSFSFDFAERFNVGVEPIGRLVAPADNAVSDLNPALDRVRINSQQNDFRIELMDFFAEIDDSTVSSDDLTVQRDGAVLASGSDYTFSYDPTTNVITLTPTASFSDGSYEIVLGGGPSPPANVNGVMLTPSTLEIEIDTSIPDSPDSVYLSFKEAALVNNGALHVEDDDIVSFDGTTYSMVLDGSDVGLSALRIDALAATSPSEWLLSFSRSGTVPGNSGDVDDSDIVKFTATELGEVTAGTFSLYFDGSDVGLTGSGEDIDGLSVLNDGRLVLTTSASLGVSGVSGEDEDLLVFDPTSLGTNTAGTWSLYFDGSDVQLGTEDLSGVSIYPTGDIYMTNKLKFDVGWISGADEDVFSFRPSTLGEETAGPFATSLFFDGCRFDVGDNDVYGIHVFSTNPPNLVPIAENDSATVEQNASVTIDVLADNGMGPDHDDDGTIVAATVMAVAGPDNGNLNNNGDGTFLYTPVTDFVGLDQFTYTVEDNEGAVSQAATVTVTASGSVNNLLYFSLDGNAILPGGLSVKNEDILVYDGATFEMFFDGSDVGLSSESLSSFSIVNGNEILISLSSSATVPGVTTRIDSHDIVKFNATQLGASTTGLFEIYLDGDDVGLETNGERIDAVDRLDDGRVLISTKGSSSVPGVSARDEDLIALTPTSLGADTAGSWELYFDGSQHQLGGEDVDAMAVDVNGDIIISVTNRFTLAEVSGADEDVFVYRLATDDYDSQLLFDGSQHGITLDLRALDYGSGDLSYLQSPLVIPAAASSATSAFNNLALSTTASTEEESALFPDVDVTLPVPVPWRTRPLSRVATAVDRLMSEWGKAANDVLFDTSLPSSLENDLHTDSQLGRSDWPTS